MADAKRILVVGGLNKNIPTWIQKTFEVEHVEQQSHFKRVIAPKDRPDLVIALKSWISHKQCADAREFAESSSIPFIMTDGGWSQAIQRAIESGLDWFTRDLDNSLSKFKEDEAKEVDTTLDRAWEDAYKREYERSHALEKRLKKDRMRLEEALAKLESAERRESAAARVIAEVRDAAKKHQEISEQTRAEIRRVASELRQKIDTLLSDHETSARKHVTDIEELRKKLGRLSEI
jgi:hypothetical protein